MSEYPHDREEAAEEGDTEPTARPAIREGADDRGTGEVKKATRILVFISEHLGRDDAQIHEHVLDASRDASVYRDAAERIKTFRVPAPDGTTEMVEGTEPSGYFRVILAPYGFGTRPGAEPEDDRRENGMAAAQRILDEALDGPAEPSRPSSSRLGRTPGREHPTQCPDTTLRALQTRGCPQSRGEIMTHMLLRNAGSPQYKVKPEALYRDWPADHTALLGRHVFYQADIDRVVDVLGRGYLRVPDEPDPAAAVGDGPDPVALLCRLAARRYGLIVVEPTADDPQGMVTGGFSFHVPSDAARFEQIHSLCQVLANDFSYEVHGIPEGAPRIRFTVGGIACVDQFCDAFGELTGRMRRESLYEWNEVRWRQGDGNWLLWEPPRLEPTADFFESVVERVGDGPPGPPEDTGQRPRPRRARSAARAGRVADQEAPASGPSPGHDVDIAPFTREHLERVRKALTLGFLVVEGKWHHDGLEPYEGELAFETKALYLGCCRRYGQPWVVVYASPRRANIAAGLPGIDGDRDAALTVREACEVYTAASPFAHPSGCHRYSYFARFLEGVGVRRLPRDTCETAGFRLHEVLAEIQDRRADPDGRDGYGRCVGPRGDRAEAVDGVATVAAAMAGSHGAGAERRHYPGWPAWRRRRFIHDDLLYLALFLPQTGGRHPECFDADTAPRLPGKRRSRR